AVRVEIHELGADGEVVGRTYLERPPSAHLPEARSRAGGEGPIEQERAVDEESSLSPEEAEALMEEARQACQVAAEHAPEPSSWGMCVYGDAPPAIGGGIPVFLWFADRAAMLDFVKRLLTFLNPGPAGVDWGPVAASVRPIVDAIERSEIPLATGQ